MHVCYCPAGAQALRCLALAYKSVPQASSSSLSPLDEAGLTFIAMVAMHDPPRRECAAAIQLCRQVWECVTPWGVGRRLGVLVLSAVCGAV